MAQKVVGFPIDYKDWGYSEIRNLTDHEKNELALSDEEVVIYDCPKDFFDDLNTDLVDTENMYWFIIEDLQCKT